MNINKTRATIMRGLEVKKDRLDHYKIIDCKNEKVINGQGKVKETLKVKMGESLNSLK